MLQTCLERFRKNFSRSAKLAPAINSCSSDVIKSLKAYLSISCHLPTRTISNLKEILLLITPYARNIEMRTLVSQYKKEIAR